MAGLRRYQVRWVGPLARRLARLPMLRRVGRLGLQAKLVVCFMLLLVGALGGSHWLFLHESRAALWRSASQRAVMLAQTLAMAGRIPLDQHDDEELSRLAREFLKNNEIVNVAFADGNGTVLAAACPDPDFHWQDLTPEGRVDPQPLMKPRAGNSRVLGSYVAVTAPVLRYTLHGDGRLPSTRLVGYVTVSASMREEAAALRRAYGVLLMVGCGVCLMTFPAVYALVRRIFTPIRQLVDATNRIAAGDLSTQVNIDAPDLIGTLARSFNEMVEEIQRQRQELADANRSLERKVADRTGELEAANRRLKSEIAEKEDFLRAVSHDLNAPLRNISGMAAMLLLKGREKFDEETIHRLERIQQNVQAETDLIGELLELSRIKTRRQKMEAVDLSALLREVVDVFEDDLRSRRIALTIDTPLPLVSGERARFRQLFQNLLDNAIKYMGDGLTREIHVGCHVSEAETEFYVRDTGVGMEAEDLTRVFYVFRRGKNAATQGVPGKGVGLASVKSIVETYEGSIWIESLPGQGSTFRFTINGRFLPRRAAGGEPPARAA